MEPSTSEAGAEAGPGMPRNGAALPRSAGEAASATLPARFGDASERLSLYRRWSARGGDGTGQPSGLDRTSAPMQEIRARIAALSQEASAPIAVPAASPQRMPEQRLEFWSARLLVRRLADLISSVFSDPLFKSGYGQ